MEQLLGAANRVGIAICNYAPAMNAMTEFNPWSKKMLTLCTLSLSFSLFLILSALSTSAKSANEH